MDEDEETGRLVTTAVQLSQRQIDWLRERTRRHFSRSMAAEVRRVIAEAMEEEARQVAAAT